MCLYHADQSKRVADALLRTCMGRGDARPGLRVLRLANPAKLPGGHLGCGAVLGRDGESGARSS